MPPGVHARMLSVEALAPYIVLLYFTSIPSRVRYAVVRRQQNLHARGRSWELVEHVCGKATSRS